MLIKAIVSNLIEFRKNPYKYVQYKSEHDECTVMACIIVASLICALIAFFCGLSTVLGEKNSALPVWAGAMLMIFTVITCGFSICYSVLIDDKVVHDKITNYKDASVVMCIISTFMASLLSGSFFAIIALSIVIDVVAAVVYFIPVGIVKLFLYFIGNEPSKKMKTLYSGFLNFEAYDLNHKDKYNNDRSFY